jgi:hypothetical protein
MQVAPASMSVRRARSTGRQTSMREEEFVLNRSVANRRAI